MTAVTPVSSRLVLADRVFPRSLLMNTVLVVSGTALVTVLAQLAIPMWPVPITMQTFGVLVVGTVLGPFRGALSLALYLVLGVAGLPIFSEGKHGSLLDLTSGGFIIAFVPAALLVGWLAKRAWDRKVVGTIVSFLAGTVVMYAIGLPWLYFSLQHLGKAVWGDYLGYDSLIAATIGAGLLPFLVGDALKALLAAGLLPAAWKLVNRADRVKTED